jgi:hypothetical protein
MTETERSFWREIRERYVRSKAIADQVWGTKVPPEVLASAVHTLFIASGQHRNGHHSVDIPRQDAPGATNAATAPACPVCAGPMRDQRAAKTNPRQPDWKCVVKSCDGALWPPKKGAAAR